MQGQKMKFCDEECLLPSLSCGFWAEATQRLVGDFPAEGMGYTVILMSSVADMWQVTRRDICYQFVLSDSISNPSPKRASLFPT